MKNLIFFLVALVCSCNLSAQTFEIPNGYSFSKVEDYKRYENDVVSCVDWLINTPLDQESIKRQKASRFLMTWLEGSPDVVIEISADILTFDKASPDLFLVFMGGWAKYSIETKDYNNKLEGNIAGIEAVIELYKQNKDILSKDKNIEKYLKLKYKGKLRDYIKEKI